MRWTEQYSRKNSVEILEIPEDVCENEGTVLKIAYLGVKC